MFIEIRKVALLTLVFGQAMANSASAYTVRVWIPGGQTSTNAFPGVTNIVTIAGGYNHFLALTSEGQVLAWGNTEFDQTTIPPSVSNIVSIAAGMNGSMALRADGNVVCWGTELGVHVEQVPTEATNVVAFDIYRWGAAVVRADGKVIGWGGVGNNYGFANAIGISTWACGPLPGRLILLRADRTVTEATSCENLNRTPVEDQLTNIVAIDSSFQTAFALRGDGRVFAWGDSMFPTYLQTTNVPLNLTNATAIAAAGEYCLALRSDGTITAWGAVSNAPVDLPYALGIGAGGTYAAALVSDGVVYPPAFMGTPSPQSQNALSGGTAAMTVRVVGVPPYTIQWYFGTNVITGATNTTLRLEDLQTTQSGNYTASVSNQFGITFSSPAVLNVGTSLAIALVPRVSLTADIGSTYQLEFLPALGATNNWTALTSVTISNSPQYFYDDSAIGHSQRFYRLTPSTNAP